MDIKFQKHWIKVQQFKNYIQLSYGAPFTQRMEKGIQTLGALISEYVSKGGFSKETFFV